MTVSVDGDQVKAVLADLSLTSANELRFKMNLQDDSFTVRAVLSGDKRSMTIYATDTDVNESTSRFMYLVATCVICRHIGCQLEAGFVRVTNRSTKPR